MSLIRRKSNKSKTINIGGKEFYTSTQAAERLGFSKSKLMQGIRTKRYDFQIATLEDFPNAQIYVSVRDIEVFLRQRAKRLEQF